jgi:hypothetical protein
MERLYYPPPQVGGLASGGGTDVDVGQAAEKIGKLIPSELLTAYAALVSASMVIKYEAARLPVAGICFAICLILTPLYLKRVATEGKPKRNHLIVSTIAFPVWAYLISGNQVVPQLYDAALATIVALLFSLISGLIPMNK